MEVKRLTSRKLAALMWGVAAIVALNVLWVISDNTVLPDEYLAGLSLLAISGLCGYELRVQGEIDKKGKVPLYADDWQELPNMKRVDEVVEQDLGGMSMKDFLATEEEETEPAPTTPSPHREQPSWREAKLQDLTPSPSPSSENEDRGGFDYEGEGRSSMN